MTFGPGPLFLKVMQWETVKAAMPVDFLTPASAGWIERQVPAGEKEARRRCTAADSPEERAETGRNYRRLWRRRRGALRRISISKLSRARGFHSMPTVMTVDGVPETDVELWQESLRAWLLQRFSTNDPEYRERKGRSLGVMLLEEDG